MIINKYRTAKLRQRDKDKRSPKSINGRYKPKESTRFRLLIRLELAEGQNQKYSRVLFRVNHRYRLGSERINSIPLRVRARSSSASFCPFSSSGTGTTTLSLLQSVPRLGLLEAKRA